MRRWLATFAIILSMLATHPRLALADISTRAQADRALRAAARIVGTGANNTHRYCSGAFLSEHLVLTAAHCTREMFSYIVFNWQDASYSARSYKVDMKRDLALLWVNQAVPARYTTLADFVAAGDLIWLAGAPGGGDLVVTRGMVGRVENTAFRNTAEQEDIGTARQQILWLDVRTFYGGSGGGVFDDEGRLVGIMVRVEVVANPPVIPGMILWAYAVGLEGIKEFLR